MSSLHVPEGPWYLQVGFEDTPVWCFCFASSSRHDLPAFFIKSLCVCVCACICMCIQVEARGQYTNCSLPSCLEKTSLAEPGDSTVRWSVNFRDPLCPCHLRAGIINACHCPWRSNSGPHAWRASALPGEPSPRPFACLLQKKLVTLSGGTPVPALSVWWGHGCSSSNEQ